MADKILNIDKKVNDLLIPAIDQTKFLGLDKSNAGRIELFLFAMSLGLKENKRTPLSAGYGFIRESSIHPNDMAKLYAILVHEMRKLNEEEKIGNKDTAFQVAQEYANTGFQIIRRWLDNSKQKNEESILWDLILEMDNKYEHLFQK